MRKPKIKLFAIKSNYRKTTESATQGQIGKPQRINLFSEAH